MDTFVPARLTGVRKRRGLTIAALSIGSGLSTKSISDFENNKKEPSLDSLQRLGQALAVPQKYFQQPPLNDIPVDAVSFRAPTKMTARNRDVALQIAAHAIELREWIDRKYETPAVDVPTLDKYVGAEAAERASEVVRAKWGLGQQPLVLQP